MDPREFVKEYCIKSLVCCFSGGKDSLVATHYTLSQLEGFDIDKYVVFVDTTVMVPGTADFVKEVCERFNWNLKVLKPHVDFWSLAEKMGMPTMHRRWCCYHLKLAPIREFVKNLAPQRAEVTGLRKEESVRRRNLRPLFYHKKNHVWKYAPILEWTEKDVLKYMKAHGLPMPPHYRKGIRETCCCGAFSNVKQMMIVRGLYPDFYRKFIELESRFKSGGACFYFDNKPTYAKDLAKQKTLLEFEG